jgi:hypothetical protein
MKKLFYPQWHLWCFCQNDQTESANPTTNAIAKRGCVLAAQLAADLVFRMNEIEAFTQKWG